MPHRAMPPTVDLITPSALMMNFLYIPLVLFINEYAEQLVVLMLFMIVDFITGIAKSYMLNERFSYHRASAGVITKFTTLLIPFLLNFFSNGTQHYDSQITNILPYGLSLLIAIEFYSILGNLYSMRTKKELEDKDLLSFFILKLRKFFEAWIKAFKG
jgi:toxin secretion/phage lysis holin